MTGPAPFTAFEFRRALGAFATGVTVITSRGSGHCCGMTANAVTSLSLDPPLVLVCIGRGGEIGRAIAANGSFAVNILSADQEALSRRFAAADRPRGESAFDGVPWRAGATGAPILDGVAGHLDCHVHAVQAAGDHDIVIGAVRALDVRHDHPPLLFVHGRYARIAG